MWAVIIGAFALSSHRAASGGCVCQCSPGLQANDFEAYQELLREQGADETQGVRYEVITKFLNDTEEYLHKLAGKVSNVKLQQEASEAFTKATAEARAMVRT